MLLNSIIIQNLKKNAKLFFYCLTIIFFLAGIIYSTILGNNLRYFDEHEYYTLAGNLVSTFHYSLDGKNLTAFRPPGYPFLLAFLKFCGFNIILLRIINFVFLLLDILFVFRLLSHKVGEFSGLICLSLFIIYPVIFYTAGILYPQIFSSFLIVLIIYLLFNHMNLFIGKSIFIGLISGLLILTAPIFIFSLLIIYIAAYRYMRRNKVKVLLIIIITAASIVGLWSLRNYYVFNSFVFVSTNGGFNLILGNSKNSEPNLGLNTNISQYDNGTKGLNEAEIDTYYRDKAIEYVLHNKKKSIILYFRKVLNYFNFENLLYTKSESSEFRNLIMLISYGILLLILLGRFILIKKVRMTGLEKLILIIYFSNAFFTAIFFTRIRFRVPFDILLIIALSIFLFNFSKVFYNNPFKLKKSISN